MHHAPLRPLAAASAASAALALALLAPACQNASAPGEAQASGYEGARAAELARGAELYEDHCSLCHGAFGAGNGPASPLLFPPPRDFSQGLFRIVSTEDRVPSEADLVRTLRRGLPGSAMPGFGWMPEEDLAALAAHVRRLSVEGVAARLVARARPDWEPIGRDEALARAKERLTPGAVADVPPAPEVTPAVLARGRETYLRTCAVCHGEDGAGRPSEPRWDEDGNLNWARDFTSGILKGGASYEALARRVLLGMPGTAMVPTVLDDPAELAALVAYVRSLIPPGSEERLVHRVGGLEAPRVDALPTEPDDARWDEVQELDVVLSPLAWDDQAVLGARVAAVHDGERIAFRLRWLDPTREDRPGAGVTPYPDAASIALTSDPAPPLIGMGSARHPVELWHWQAYRPEDVGGYLDILGRPPHQPPDPLGLDEGRLDAPLYVPAPGMRGPLEQADELAAEGFEHVEEPVEAASDVDVVPAWEGARWSVVFTRALEPPTDRSVPLLPGAPALFAVAVWNGAAGDRRGRKSFSIWQRVVPLR